MKNELPPGVVSRKHRRSGFSLIELITATSVLTVTLIGLIGALLSIHRTERLAGHRDQAAALVNSVAESLRQAPLGTLSQYRPTIPPNMGFIADIRIEGKDAAGTSFAITHDTSNAPSIFAIPVELRIALTASPGDSPPFTMATTIARSR